MGDFCCPVEFICVHYVTFSKSPLRVILCILSQRKSYGKILKTKELLTEKRVNQKMGSERESIFTFKMDSSTVSNYFYHKQTQSILQNFGFHNEYGEEYEKVFIMFWILQTNFCDSAHVEWLRGPCSKKVAGVFHKWTRWIKIITHSRCFDTRY